MIESLEALIALSQCGTMTRTATRLRVSQSAISKRIAQLEGQCGQKVIQRSGRKVELTNFGIRLAEKSVPLIAGIREALWEESEDEDSSGVLRLAIAESIIISWGAKTLHRVQDILPGLQFDLTIEKSRLCLDHVRAGESMVALCPGLCPVSDLHDDIFLEEPMVLVPSALKPFKFSEVSEVKVITSDPQSETWTSIKRRLAHLTHQLSCKFKVYQTFESFAGIVQLAKAGFGHGLVPIGVAKALEVPPECIIEFPEPGLRRPISLIARQSTFAHPLVVAFRQALVKCLPLEQ